MSITLTALMKQRYDTAANWTAQNPTLLAGEFGIESDTKRWKVGTGSTAWTSLLYSNGGTYPLVNADIAAGAAIVDTKLATIATALKVSNSATTAVSVNTASAIVARDASGNFTAGTITAALTGAASSNVLKAGDTMTGVLAVTAGTAALPGIAVSGDPNTGIYSPGADQLAISTGGTSRLAVSTTAVSSTLAVDHPLGAVGTPSITFTGDLNTGIWSPTADTIAFSEGGAEAMRIDSSGRLLVGTTANANGGILQLSGGITFPATAVAASDPNTLDDYEEGTWTPNIANFTVTGDTTSTATYTKIGRVVYFNITFVNTGTIAYATSCLISLPFAGISDSGMVAMSLDSNTESQTSGKSGVQMNIDGPNGRFFVGSFTTTSAGQQLNFGGFYRVS